MLKTMCMWEKARKITLAGLIVLAGLVALTGCLEGSFYSETDGKEHRIGKESTREVVEAARTVSLKSPSREHGRSTGTGPEIIIDERVRYDTVSDSEHDNKVSWYATREASTVLYIVAGIVFVSGIVIGIVASGARGRLIGAAVGMGGVVLAVVNTVAAARPEMALITLVICGVVVIGSITGFVLWRVR